MGVGIVVFVVSSWLMMILAESVVYKVGDDSGWTTIGNVNYTAWALPKHFQLGDQIVFEYNRQFHNVMQVNHAEYRACNVSKPMSTYTTGNDTITIQTPGHHFYLCGVPGHCQAGQKVDIHVLAAADAPPPHASGQSAVPSTAPPSMVPSPSGNAPAGPRADYTPLGWLLLQALMLAFWFAV